jgi:multidrug efflux system outer membrane protein
MESGDTMRLICTFAAAFILTGCTELNTAFPPPEIKLPDHYSRLAPVQAPSREDTEWWRNFNDPVLNNLIAQGLSGNLSVAQANARLEEAAAEARRAGVLISGPANADIRNNSKSADTASGSVTANIGLAGESRYHARAARDRLEAAKFDTIEARREVLSQVAQTYMDMRFFQESLQLRRRDLASRTRTLRDIQAQLDAGEATRLDLLRAQSLLAETRASIARQEASIIVQRNRLSTLLGLPVGALPINLGYKGAQPRPKRVAKIGVPADLLRARPDIRRAEKLYAAALSDVGASKAARYPSLRLSGVVIAPLNGGSSAQTLLAGLVMPIFDQPALAAATKSAEARVQQAYLRWRLAVLQAVEEVENAQAQLRAGLAERNAAYQQVTLDLESLSLARELFAGGRITVLDVLDRERALSSSRTALAQATRSVSNSYIALRVALGRGHPLLSDEAAKTN